MRTVITVVKPASLGRLTNLTSVPNLAKEELKTNTFSQADLLGLSGAPSLGSLTNLYMSPGGMAARDNPPRFQL
jgi:hypothetical protein